MKISVHHYHHYPKPDPEQMALLLGILKELTMVTAEVQALLDKARASEALSVSVDAGMTALRMQVNDLGMKIDSLTAAAAATATEPAVAGISAEDKQALLEAASTLDHTIATLQRDIPTNVSVVAAPAPVAPPTAAEQATHEEDAAAASAATPLAGTGAPADAPAPAPAADDPEGPAPTGTDTGANQPATA